MTEERLLTLLQAYGAEPARWPEAERAEAQALLALSADARIRDALAEAQALDGALAALPEPALSDAAYAQLLQQARPGMWARLRGILGWQGPLWRPLGAMAAALIFGIALGLNETAVQSVALPGTAPAAQAAEDGEAGFLDGGLL
jgi:hypothetical protein